MKGRKSDRASSPGCRNRRIGYSVNRIGCRLGRISYSKGSRMVD